MGSSTRNKYSRGNKLIMDNISNGSISSSGNGIGNILGELFFPKKGLSKPRKVLQEKIYSNTCNISIQRISKLAKIIKSGNYSALGIGGGISTYSKGEISEIFCEYLGIENDEILKTSFKESISEIDVIKKGLDVVSVISDYIKNVISNVFKHYTLEDSLDILPNITEEKYEEDVNEFSDSNILPLINLEVEQIDFEDEEENCYIRVDKALKNIMLKLQRVGE